MPEPTTQTILLLDDEESLTRSLSTYLRRSGYEVLVANTPGEAFAIAGSHPGPVHLLVSDLVVPEMSGSEVAKRIEKIRPGIRVLVMSGYLEDDVLAAGSDVLGRGFISKPFDLPDLLARVRELLDDASG